MNTNVSNKEQIILALLTGGEKYGWDIAKESDGEISRAVVYSMLTRLEAKGFIKTSRVEEREIGGRTMPRRYYQITGLGERALSIKEFVVASAGEVYA